MLCLHLNFLSGEETKWCFSCLHASEFLELDETGLKVRFTGPYRLGNAPTIYTEHPVSRPMQPSKRSKFVFKVTIVNGGKDNAVAIGLGVKQRSKLGFESNDINRKENNDEEEESNVYIYKYHGRNGYIYSQTETSKYFTEEIIRSQTYGTGDVIILRLNLVSRVVTFLKNERNFYILSTDYCQELRDPSF